MNLNLQAKAALVTGGSRGIGKAIALAFAAEGARVAICGRDERQLEQARDEIAAATRSEVICVKANTGKVNDIRRFITTAAKKFSRIDILVNNAGGGQQFGAIDEITDEEWEAQIQARLLGYLRAAREVIPVMRESGGGRIINIIGITGSEPGPRALLPSVINGALLTFTKALSKDLERDRISVTAISPAAVDTALTGEMIAALAVRAQTSPEEIRQSLQAALPQGRFASPEEIARIAVFLASDAAALVNGIVIPADAGKTAAV